MFGYVAKRSQLGEVLSGRRPTVERAKVLELAADLPRIEPQSAFVIWSHDPIERPELPAFLITEDGQERELLAWLVTFAPSLRPFTAFCRVMGTSGFRRLATALQRPDLGRVENACVGLVLGEVLSSEEMLSRPRDTLTVAACASALSFALAREMAIYKDSILDADELRLRWSRARQLTRQRERELDGKDVVAAAEILRDLLRVGTAPQTSLPVSLACRELLEQGEISSSAAYFDVSFERAVKEMSGTREERVEAFERVLGGAISFGGSIEKAFVIGYLASRISPGTLTHASLLGPGLKRYPSAMLWYGLCAGLARDTAVLAELGGIGRRLLRELLATQDLIGRPRADVSAAELDILLSGDRNDDFTVYSHSQLTVELVPGVSTVLSWSSRTRARKPNEVPGAERIEDRSWLDQELSVAIGRLIDMHARLRAEAALNSSAQRKVGPEQPTLFDPHPSKRSGKRR